MSFFILFFWGGIGQHKLFRKYISRRKGAMSLISGFMDPRYLMTNFTLTTRLSKNWVHGVEHGGVYIDGSTSVTG
jgi:hypothetical protein